MFTRTDTPSVLLTVGTFALLSVFTCATHAAPVELRLVVHDKPEVGVDKMEHRRPIVSPTSTGKGVEMKQIGVDLSCWARNVRLDGQPVFERYHDGKYIDRISVARPDLKPGDHTLWPGDHIFTVGKDGSVTTKDPELIVAGTVVSIKCYPVTIQAYRAGEGDAHLPMSMRIAPVPSLTIRETDNASKHAANSAEGRNTNSKELLELLPEFDDFAPLTVWLPANQVGQGYQVHPVGLTFQLGPRGVAAGANDGWTSDALAVSGNRIEIPLYNVLVSGVKNAEAAVPSVEVLKFKNSGKLSTVWYPRRGEYEFRVSDFGPGIAVDGNLKTLPHKLLRVDIGDTTANTQRGLVVELDSDHATPGGVLNVRVQAVDSAPSTLAGRKLKDGNKRVSVAENALKAAKSELANAEKAIKTAQAAVEASTKTLEAAESDEDKTLAKSTLESSQAKLKEAETQLAAATVAVEKATPEVDAAKSALPDLQAAANSAATLNPLADAKPWARLQRRGKSDWLDLPLKVAEANHANIKLPSDVNGFYRLRIGVQSNSNPLEVEQWIAVSRKDQNGLGLFTQRGRDAFYRGESFWLGLGATAGGKPITAGQALSIDLVDPAGQRLSLVQQKTTADIASRETFIARLDSSASAALTPGRYTVEARLGSVAAERLTIDIVDPAVATHFTNLLIGKYNTLQRDYEDVLRGTRDAEELAAGIARLGYNAFQGMSYDMQRVKRSDDSLERLARRHPELGPWESYYTPSGRDRFMNAMVRHNLRFYENLFSYHDTALPREPNILDACERYVSLETASMRYSPAFRGVGLYDEFYESSDTDTSQEVLALSFKAQEMAYRAKHKTAGLTSSEALRALERFAGRPFGQRQVSDLEKFRTWPEYHDSEWRDFSLRMGGAAKQVAPWSTNFTLHRFFGGNGGNITGNGIAPEVTAGLDLAACVMYKDGGLGDRPVFAAMQADVMRVRDDLPVWTQLHNFNASGLYGQHLVRQAFFALSQKIEGITYFTIQSDPKAPAYIDNRDAVQDIAQRICTPYGDLLMASQRGYKRVAVYYSRAADQLAGRKVEKPPYQCEGLWVACMRAGYPADFLYDNQVVDGRGLEYEVVFAPGFTYEDEAPPAILAALRRLVDAGKLVVVERASKLPLEGVVRIDSDLDEYDDKQGGAFPRYVDFESKMVFDQSEKTTKLVHELLKARKILPAAEHKLLVGPDWLTCRKSNFLFVSNFADTGFAGLHQTLYQAPDLTTLRFPKRGAVCYDMLAMQPVDVKVDGDWMTLDVDLTHGAGKIFAFLPAKIEQVVLRASQKLTAGDTLQYDIAMADVDGQPLDAGVPLEISLVDAQGNLRHHVYRAATPGYRGAYVLPVNVPAGPWKLLVRELISGAAAEIVIAVTAGKAPVASLDTQTVWLHDMVRIRHVLEQPEEKLIVLDDEQSALAPQAERLQTGLQKNGVKSRIVRLADVLRLPLYWNAKEPQLDGSRLWRGDLVQPGLFVDAPIILLGSRDNHRLIESLVRRDVLPEIPSENLPGEGRAIVAWTRVGFSNQFDTITVLAADETGLARGVDALININADVAHELPVQPPIATATIDEKASLARAKPVAKTSTRPSDVFSSQDLARTIAIDENTGRVLVGTFGYGHNLFCFSADGNLLWKQFLPEHDVYSAQWIDGGRRIVAATANGPLLFFLDASEGRVLKRLALTEWPRYHNQEGAMNTETPITVNSPLRQLLIRGSSGVMALDFDGRKLWFYDRAKAVAEYPQEAEQTVAAQFSRSVVLGDMALSPDGSQFILGEYRIVGSTREGLKTYDVWQHVPKLLAAKTGEIVWENTEEPGGQIDPSGWSVSWPKESKTPSVHNETYSVRLTSEGKLGSLEPRPEGKLLKDGGRLTLTAAGVSSVSSDGKAVYAIKHDEPCITNSDRITADEARLYRTQPNGRVLCLELATGKTLWAYQLPITGIVAPHSTGLAVATNSGHILQFDADGKLLWSTRLAEHHQRPEGEYADYVRRALRRDADSSGEFYPVGADQPGDYDTIVRLGVEQLASGDFEAIDAWKSGNEEPLAVVKPGHGEGNQAVELAAGQLITQRLARRVIPSSTYLLEFVYRVDADNAELTAGGLLSSGKAETFTGSQYMGRRGEWTFGRLAIKTLVDTTTMDIGFEATGGKIAVDKVSLRPLRFPSPNLLANAELHAVEPTFVDDLRVQYDRIPSRLRESLMRQNRVAAFKQGMTSSAMMFTQEEAFLHNGRLDDVGQAWTYTPDGIGFSVSLQQAAYVSHVVLYLNNATPDNVYSTISVLANDLETKRPRTVELVRGNRRRFLIVHFPEPIYTDSVKLLPGLHPGKHDCLTEIEIYGPLGGPDVAAKGFAADPLAHAMFMGGPTHAGSQPRVDLTGEYAEVARMRLQYPLYNAELTAVNETMSYPQASGEIMATPLPEKGAKTQRKPSAGWKFGTLTPTTTGAHYAGRLLVGSADYRLHAVADAGRKLWAYQTGGRVYSSPLPNGDDVYFGSDDGKLYKVDVDSGTLVWEFTTGDKIRSSPALADGRVYFASFDGSLYAIDAQGGQLVWQASLAKFTRSSPAVADGKVFIGDEGGVMQAFDATSGSPLWKSEKLAGFISNCPVVTSAGVLFGSESGELALVATDGATRWTKSLGTRLTGQPLATRSQLYLPTETGLQVLKLADGEPDDQLNLPPLTGRIASVLPYGDRLGVLISSADSYKQDSRTYVRYEGAFVVLSPKSEPEKGKK